jgi:ABC-type glycerol-3-phosphate transport system substrate-binding protein
VSSSFQTLLEAELPAFKNDTSLRPASSRSMTVTPYDTYCLLMNTMGGESWGRSGSAVYYRVAVPEDGLYAITLRAMQNTRSNFTVFRRITINGAVPFEQFNAMPFSSSPDWIDVPLGGATPYRVALRRGINLIGIEATSAPYTPAIETIEATLEDINTLALEINRLTGNQQDPFRDWEIASYIPDIEARLLAMAQNLIDDQAALLANDPSGASPEVLTYRMAIENLRFLAADPNSIPVLMNRFSEGTGSAAQQLASLLPLLRSQPLALDRIIVHSPDIVPQTPSVAFTTAAWEEVRRFIQSFQPDPYRSLSADVGELEVWVNRPRQYVDLLQLLVDTTFTPQTGIPVRFSIMPDESKLILANAAGNQPDVALGVSTDRPYELAIRNALYDLRTFPDFDRFIGRFSPGALLGYIINDSVYALPETQDFWVTFYREDIMQSLGLPVPDTWDEVLEILPELQRFGMNYQTPLSSGTGQRGYLITTPFLFNHGAQLYRADGFATGLESSEAVAGIEFMANIFTIYGMPLDTASFYQSFRTGTLPVGIGNAETYMRLTTAAVELNGRWSIDLYPATILDDGTTYRYATGSAQTSIMFQNTDMAEQGWTFLKWWLSTETQTRFQDDLIMNYGTDYLWFSANLDAFAQLDIPEEHRATILAQWEWMQEPVRLPGSYMQEREISNIWNRIVFQGASPRVAIDRSVTVINREIARKMEEFGYLVDGVPVRQFQVPTIETVIAWVEDAD